jgi:hypothetical protein
VKPQEKIQPPSFIHSDKDAGEAKKNAIERSRPVPASTYTNNNSESVATEFVDSNISLADELVMLRNQLQAEEKRRLSLTAQKKSYSINVGSSVAAPAAPASNFSYIAPPAPPPGPPPGPPPRPPSNNRSGKQSPLPFNDMEVLHRPIGTVEVTRVPVPCVPVPSVPVPSVPVPRVEANQVDTRHMNVDHCNLKNSRLSRIGLLQNQTADNSCYDYIDDNENNNENGNQKNINIDSNKKESKPNWKLIQQAMTSMMVKNVQKRKAMENKLRLLEENNLKILGVDANTLKDICGKPPVRLASPASNHTPTKRTKSQKRANNKHLQRMGRAMSNKLRNKSSPLCGKKSEFIISSTTTMSKQGGSLSRSSRGL